MNITKQQFFKRQTTLTEVKKEGQEKLLQTKVLIVGCGGLGSLIAVHLATSGIGEIHLVDFDMVSVSNLHRQVFYTVADIGKPKAKILANVIKKRAPFTKISVTNQPLTKNNAFELIADVDIVVDGTDSLPTKYLINDACVLKNKPLVYGSLYKFDGYVATFNVLQKEGTRSANLRDAFPKMATNIPNCEEAGTLNPIVTIIASLQTNEVLKWVLKLGHPLTNKLLIYNSSQNTQLKTALTPTFLKDNIQQIFERENYYAASCEVRKKEWEISLETLKKELTHNNALEIISVIVTPKINYPFTVHKHIPLSEFMNSNFHPTKNKKYIFICMKGNSSYTATQFLREKFPNIEAYSLEGGISPLLNN